MFKKYIAYLKNNPEKLWFKRKLYGWGWVPVRWQGWFVVGAFIGFLMWNAFSIDKDSEPTQDEMVLFFAKLLVAVILLLVICYKTGEKPRWQWGFPKEDK